MSLAAKKAEQKYQIYSFDRQGKPKQNLSLKAFTWFSFAFLISFLLSLALSICFRASMTSDSFACNELQKKIQEQLVKEKKLEKKVALLSSPQRVEKIALNKIKMVKPEEVHFLQISDFNSISYSFRKPSFEMKHSGWLDDLLDRVVLLKTNLGLASGSQ